MSKIKFYDYYWPDCYEELITYYPRFYRDVLEMVAILHAHGHLADMMQDDIDRAYQNSFLDEMDEETLSRLELFLKIGLYKERTLEERRRLVKSFFAGFGKVSASMLKEMIKSYTGADVDIVFEPSDEERNNTLYIYIQRGDVGTLYMSDINLLLSKKMPAHINWIAAVVYKRAVVVGASRKHYRFSYDLTGTKPDITLHGDLNHVEVAVEADRRNKVTDYRQADRVRELSGVYPDIALHGDLNHVDVAVEADHSNQLTDYRQAKKNGELTGVTPDIALLSDSVRSPAVVGASKENTLYRFSITGVKPDISTHGQKLDFDTGVGAAEESIIYEFDTTGTQPDIATYGINVHSAAAVEAMEENTLYGFKQAATGDKDVSGLSPDPAAHGNRHSGITAQAEVKSTSYGADYKFCGTTVAHN